MKQELKAEFKLSPMINKTPENHMMVTGLWCHIIYMKMPRFTWLRNFPGSTDLLVGGQDLRDMVDRQAL